MANSDLGHLCYRASDGCLCYNRDSGALIYKIPIPLQPIIVSFSYTPKKVTGTWDVYYPNGEESHYPLEVDVYCRVVDPESSSHALDYNTTISPPATSMFRLSCTTSGIVDEDYYINQVHVIIAYDYHDCEIKVTAQQGTVTIEKTLTFDMSKSDLPPDQYATIQVSSAGVLTDILTST